MGAPDDSEAKTLTIIDGDVLPATVDQVTRRPIVPLSTAGRHAFNAISEGFAADRVEAGLAHVKASMAAACLDVAARARDPKSDEKRLRVELQAYTQAGRILGAEEPVKAETKRRTFEERVRALRAARQRGLDARAAVPQDD